MYFQCFVHKPSSEKSGCLSFEQTWIPKNALCQFGWNWSSGSWEEDENVKSLRQRRRRRTSDKFWSEKLIWDFDWGELKWLDLFWKGTTIVFYVF